MAHAISDTTQDPMQWTRASFASPDEYAIDLDAADRSELLAGADSGRLQPGPGLADKLARAYGQVRAGRGFALLRGLPLDEAGRDRFVAAVQALGACLGTPLSQNAQGERVGHVLDATREDPTPRMFRSNLELRLHTDWTAMLSLACWQRSASGGTSIISSALTIHDQARREAPHLMDTLYRGFHYHRLGEEGPGEDPVTPYRVPVFSSREGRLSVRYQRAGIAAGHKALGLPLSETDVAAMDLFDRLAAAPDNRLAFNLERGEMLVFNNYTVLHARTAFTEHPEPERRRHLVRLWLERDGFRPVVPETNLFAFNGVPPQPGRACTFDFKQLYKDDPKATGGVPSINLEKA